MSEEQGVKGDRWTQKSKALLSRLGWVQLGDANEDIPCTRHQGRRNPHGLDLVFKYTDPFSQSDVGVIVESKTRQWKGITSSSLQDFVDQVSGSLECATVHPDFRSKFAFDGPANLGLVLAWCNDRENGHSTYNHEKYLEYLDTLSLPNKRKEFVVFVASNYDILRWVTMMEHVKSLRERSTDGIKNLEFFYPSIHGSSARLHYQLTLPMMFSDYVFCKGTKVGYVDNAQAIVNVTVVYSCADPTLNELRFMHEALKKYQLVDNRTELQVYLYTQHEYEDYRSGVEQFKRDVQKEYATDRNTFKVHVASLPSMQSVPDTYLEEGDR